MHKIGMRWGVISKQAFELANAVYTCAQTIVRASH